MYYLTQIKVRMREINKDHHREVALVLSGVEGRQPRQSPYYPNNHEHVEGCLFSDIHKIDAIKSDISLSLPPARGKARMGV